MSTPPFYCIAHQPFEWQLPDFMTMIGTGAYVPERGIALSVSYPDLAFKNQYLGEYVALYLIRDQLRAAGGEGFVGFCHYRRFALTQPVGTLRGFNYYAAPAIMPHLQPHHFMGDGATPIIGAPFDFGRSVLVQYSSNGNGNSRDLLMFFGLAVELGVISSEEAASFLSGNVFIPAPTVAFIPAAWFIQIIDALELVAERFHRDFFIPREGYLERSLAFCCERLQALLLARLATQHGWDKVIAHPQILLADRLPY